MICYVCAQMGQERPATGLCRHCQVGLCLDHLTEAQNHNRGGMHLACNHELAPRRSVPR
jgi:hypothetical protein